MSFFFYFILFWPPRHQVKNAQSPHILGSFSKKEKLEEGSQKAEHSRANCKPLSKTVAPVERVFCGEKERDYWKAMREKCPNTEVFLVPTFPRKEAHAAISSALPLVSLVEERSSSSRMFMYWMTILKLKIDYLVFIRSMTKDNFNVFVKILISLVKCFFIFDHYN